MNEQPVENLDPSASAERVQWTTPQVKLIRAGEAENNNAASFDGQNGFS